MSAEEKPTVLQNVSVTLERFSKVTVTLTAVVYVMGLIVLNVHLSQYGFFSLALLDLNYVAAGVWALTPVALVALLAFVIIYAFVQPQLLRNSSAKQPRAGRDWFVTLWSAFLIWILLAVGFFYVLGISFDWQWLIAMVAGIFLLSGILMASILLTDVAESRDRAVLLIMVVWVVIILPFYLVYFGQNVYKTIPAHLGGGAGRQVILVAKDDSRLLWESAGLRFTDDRATAPVTLILATDKELVILPAQNAHAISIDRGTAAAVVY